MSARALLCLWLAGCGRLEFAEVECAPPLADCDGVAANGCELALDVPCVLADGCASGVSACDGGTAVCEPTAVAPAGTACGGGTLCDGAGGCSLRIEAVGCGNGPTSGDALCQRTGFAGATVANGYYWFQCTGYPEHQCPGGFDVETLTCTSWCGADDCVGWAYCGTSEAIIELRGDGATLFDPEADGKMCGSFNPGWLVYLQCHR